MVSAERCALAQYSAAETKPTMRRAVLMDLPAADGCVLRRLFSFKGYRDPA
jgi:hypothetical protein